MSNGSQLSICHVGLICYSKAGTGFNYKDIIDPNVM